MPTHHTLVVTTDDRPERSGLARWLKNGLKWGVRAGAVVPADVRALAERSVVVRPVDDGMRHELYLVAQGGSEAFLTQTTLDRAAEGLRRTYVGVVAAILAGALGLELED